MGHDIDLKAADGHKLSAWRADPAGTPRGGLVVIQEIFGVNAHIRAVADGFARDGYSVVAPALFDRVERGVELDYSPESIARGRDIRGKVGWDEALADIAAAVAALKGTRVAATGYCWGGSLAWLAATRLSGISASVCYYGGQIAQFRDEVPKCPVLMHFGSEDKSIPAADIDAIRAARPGVPIHSARPGVSIHVYPGAGHGFSCDHRASYDPSSAALARTRTLEFLAAAMG